MARRQPPRPPKEEKPPVNFQYNTINYVSWLLPPKDEAKARRDVINAILMAADLVGVEARYSLFETLCWIQHFDWFWSKHQDLWRELHQRIWKGETGTATAADFDLPTEPAISTPIPKM